MNIQRELRLHPLVKRKDSDGFFLIVKCLHYQHFFPRTQLLRASFRLNSRIPPTLRFLIKAASSALRSLDLDIVVASPSMEVAYVCCEHHTYF